MEHLRITEPCKENWNEMDPTQKGAFCNKCTTEVIDFSTLTKEEIKQVFRNLSGQHFCSRFRKDQLIDLNAEFEHWNNSGSRRFQSAFLFSIFLVFGLSLFSCSSEKDNQAINELRKEVKKQIAPDIEEVVLPSTDPGFKAMSAPEEAVDVIQVESCSYPIDEITEELPEVMTIEGYYVLGIPAMSNLYVEYITETMEPITEYDENGNAIPLQPETKVFPNPSNGPVTLEIGLPSSSDHMEIKLFNMNGQYIQNIHSGPVKRGTSRFAIDLSEQTTGMYLITIMSGDHSETVRVSKL